MKRRERENKTTKFTFLTNNQILINLKLTNNILEVYHLSIKNLENIDAVIHLVGMNKEMCKKKRAKSLAFKKKVTLNIIKACKHNKIKKLIYLSSSQVYKDFQKKTINEK